MRMLIAEDDYASRKMLFKFLSKYGECDLTVDGMEALDAYLLSLDDKNPYELIFLDIMMPKIDGLKVLKAIRDIENQKGIAKKDKVRIIMTTAMVGTDYVNNSFEAGCEAYAAKPIDTNKLLEVIRNLGFNV